MPMPFLQNTSPYEKLYNITYDFNQLKVFGCLCYSSTLSPNRTKFDHRARVSIFLGFPCNIEGYVVYDIKNHDVKISRNVIFYEDIFPSQDFDNDEFISHNDNTVSDAPFDSQSNNDHNNVIATPLDNQYENQTDINPPRRSNRVKQAPTYLKDYEVNLTPTSSKRNIKYRIESFISFSRLSPSFKQVVLTIDSSNEPKTYKEAASNSNWQKAMQEEISALEHNNT